MSVLHACYRDAALRDPREFPLGYLAADGPTGALAPFLWFRDEGELLRFVATTELGLLRLNPPAHAGVLAALSAALRARPDMDEMASKLTAAFRGWTEILWIGSFADLCHGDGTIPESLRAEYRWNRHGSETGTPLTPEEVPELVDLIRSLAERCGGAPAAAAAPVGGPTRQSG